ncbi:hypothetical protein SBRCBS47491_004413 [Sporothrix bragantina]|uniref:Carboxylic ester hydrolase n=1 Tax=Sporothrix bragantina TaxID=671064 RepID=A0ABP0BNS3_9PEZI
MPVQVTGGLVEGVPSAVDAGITVYRGIPYAAPPVGRNRFRAPQAVVPWSGVRLCDTTGPQCPQLAPDPKYPNILEGVPQSEDCLYLNMHVPASSSASATAKMAKCPVFVWLHGGMFREGGSADPHYDGTGLAQQGVIVVVPVFRLGALGFLAHPVLSQENAENTENATTGSASSGNMGILDALQVLQWVHDNIAQFGGDPGRVTVGGQSSGAAMAHVLLLSPRTRGLLHGVALHSGVRSYREPSLANAAPSYRLLRDAEADGEALLHELGTSIDELRRDDCMVPLESILRLALRKDTRMWGPPPLFRAVLDGDVFPQPYSATMSGAAGPPNDVPVLTGQNAAEGGVYNEPRFTAEDLRDCVEARLGPHGNGNGSEAWVRRYFDVYGDHSDSDMDMDDPTAAADIQGNAALATWNRSARDCTRLNIALWAQEYHTHTTSPVFGYYFTHAPPPWHGWTPDFSLPKVPGYTHAKGPLFGAHHNAEMSYAFNSMAGGQNRLRPWTDADYQMGNTMATLWANFCKYGNPNGKDGNGRPEGLPQWPSLTEQPDVLMQLGGNFEPVLVAGSKAKAFWTEYIQGQKAW